MCILGGPISYLHKKSPYALDYLTIDIINYEQLKKCQNRNYDLLVLDEGQYCKNPKSARTKEVFRRRKYCRQTLILTGTPILNRPEELFPLLQLTAPLQWDPAGLKGQELCGPGEGAGFKQYANRYCDAKKRFFGRKSFWDTSGASNLEELHQKLRDSVMIRRFKKDVLPELPPKRRQLIALPQTGVKTLLTEEMKIFGELTEDLTEASNRVAFSEISKVRRELAIKKVGPVVEHVKNTLETAEKVIVFAHHRDMVDGLLDGLKEFWPVRIVGETLSTGRYTAVNAFQNDPGCRVIVGSIGAMGTGHTLTASSLVIFAEQSWSPSEMSQAEDRAHRIGQRDAVLVQHLVFENSLDSHMCEVLLKKQDIIDRAIDGKAIS